MYECLMTANVAANFHPEKFSTEMLMKKADRPVPATPTYSSESNCLFRTFHAASEVISFHKYSSRQEY